MIWMLCSGKQHMRLTAWGERNSIRCSSNKKNCSASNQEKGKQDWYRLPRKHCRCGEEGKGLSSFSLNQRLRRKVAAVKKLHRGPCRQGNFCFPPAKPEKGVPALLPTPALQLTCTKIPSARNLFSAKTFGKISHNYLQLCWFHCESAIKYCGCEITVIYWVLDSRRILALGAFLLLLDTGCVYGWLRLLVLQRWQNNVPS